MRVNLEWLQEWTDVGSDADALAEQLTTAGLEVDAIWPAAPIFDGVVVAEVLETRAHPQADRLRVCEVTDGIREYTVVCGASNVAGGVKAALAKPGARLPEGRSIKTSELRGVSSEGMLCSAAELEIGDGDDGILILPFDAPLGEDLRRYLRLDDSVLDIDITPNRGDCFSVLGIARELAAVRRRALGGNRQPTVKAVASDIVEVSLEAGEACPRFAGRVIRNLRLDAVSPLWLRERLRRAGLRPIHPVVDVTNYVMLELGQPLHGYDWTKLGGQIIVRFAVAGERLTLLDGKEVELDGRVLVIADASEPIGLAGVIGGATTAVDESTRDIFLESAFFSPSSIAGRARRFGLHTDASVRFERGVDPEHQVRAIERASELLLDIAGGEPGPLVSVQLKEHLPKTAKIHLRRERIERLLGIDIAPKTVRQVLQRLGMRVTNGKESWTVTPPAFRFDLKIEEDLIEEIGRMIGYDNIPATPGAGSAHPGAATESFVDVERIADQLAAAGYTEIVTYSFIDESLEQAVNPGRELVRLRNPISQDMRVMRSSLWPGLLATAQRNLSRQQSRLRLFEVGPQFAAGPEGVIETGVVAGLAAGDAWPEHWDLESRETDYFDVKADVETLLALTGRGGDFIFEAGRHPALRPGQTARIALDGAPVGWLGALHPELHRQLDLKRDVLLFGLRLDPTFAMRPPAFRPYSKFPSIRRDLAVVVDEATTAQTLVDHVRAAAGVLLQDVIVFDIYRGTAIDSRRKSVALGLILQGTSRTLTDVDADQAVRSVTRHLERELGATIRT